MADISKISSVAIANVWKIGGVSKSLIESVDGALIPSSVTYATWNPSDKNANISLSSGNLVATASNTAWKSVRWTIGKSSWKWYWEIVVNWPVSWNAMVWVWSSTDTLNSFVWSTSTWWSYYSYTSKVDAKNAYNNNVNLTYGAAFVRGDVIGVALDMWAGTIIFYKNNVSQGTLSWLTWTMYPMFSPYDNTLYCTANFGATAFTYSPPSWYNSWLYT